MHSRKNSPVCLVANTSSPITAISQPGPTLAPNQQSQPPQGLSEFSDSSGPLFSIYLNVADKEDKKMITRWRKDAGEILIFVSPRVGVHMSSYMTYNSVDWFIFRCGCCTARRDRSIPDPQQSGYLFILSQKHLPGSRRPEFNSHICPFSYR